MFIMIMFLFIVLTFIFMKTRLIYNHLYMIYVIELYVESKIVVKVIIFYLMGLVKSLI